MKLNRSAWPIIFHILVIYFSTMGLKLYRSCLQQSIIILRIIPLIRKIRKNC